MRILNFVLGIIRIVFALVFAFITIGFVISIFNDYTFIIQISKLLLDTTNQYINWSFITFLSDIISQFDGIILTVYAWIFIVVIGIAAFYAVIKSILAVVFTVIGTVSPEMMDELGEE